jgi:TolA-binding protein
LKVGDDKAPGIAYRAAELFYTHNQLDEARKRFEASSALYPKSEVAKYAVNLIVESYLIDKNWARSKSVAAHGCRGTRTGHRPEVDLYKELTKFKLGGRSSSWPKS